MRGQKNKTITAPAFKLSNLSGSSSKNEKRDKGKEPAFTLTTTRNTRKRNTGRNPDILLSPPFTATTNPIITSSNASDSEQPTTADLLNKLNVINRESKNAYYKKFLAGAKLGALLVSSQLILYWTLAAISDQPFSDELEKINLIKRTDLNNTAANTTFSYLIYLAGSSVILGLQNIAKAAWESRQSPSNSNEQVEQSNQIDSLYNMTVEERQLKIKTWQKYSAAAAFGLFIIPNFIFCLTYYDVGESAKKYLPKIGGMYTGLNEHAGLISLGMNLALNQWFCFTIIQFVIAAYNDFQFIRNNYHKDGSASKWYAGFKMLETSIISTLASLAFYYLTKDDPCNQTNNPKCTTERSAWIQPILPLVPYSALIVYGAVLNIEGALSILKDFGRLWNYLKKNDRPSLKDSLNAMRNATLETFKELAYFSGLNAKYLGNHKLNIPAGKPNERSHLLEEKNNLLQPDNKISKEVLNNPKWTMGELQSRVENRIRVYNKTIHQMTDSPTKFIQDLIQSEIINLTKENMASATKATIWEKGYTRYLLSKLVTIGTIGCMSVILFAYGNLVNAQLTEKIFNETLHLDLVQKNAASRLMTLYMFYPFIKLVVDASAGLANNTFNGVEHKIQEVYHSLQVYKGTKTSDDFDYKDRFHFTNKQEAFLFTTGFLIFAAQAASFLITPSTSGTVMYLLDEQGYLNDSTKQISFWFTALFNSYGATSFLLYAKSKITDMSLTGSWKMKWNPNKDKAALLSQSHELFSGMKNANIKEAQLANEASKSLASLA